ncbi:hypothetical protein CPT_Mendera_092 [Stenotrophomonas phage Mendera]|uniref:Uncharacterized protein n=1 Tax=Stenotrophomonas phage Mendera TaxID=2650877 RepID=A0A5P8PIT4_9CAUD|nr:hypothetical protein HWC60_gp092 [Stenotrophomonas phage Mendera]QFR56641.1 hypothetical protein CPT_Mendera_092 [Stenotrophomonas phage Mendera]
MSEKEYPKSGNQDEFIKDRLSKISALYGELEEYATEKNLYFHYEGPAGYGDGGAFRPNDIGVEDEWTGNISDGWQASSQSC